MKALGTVGRVLLFGVAICALSPRPGDAGPYNGARKALVIGNGDNEFVPKLKNAANDGRAMAMKLMSLGFDVMSRTDVSVAAMNEALVSFDESAKGAEIALVFYSGSSFQLSGESRLPGIDLHADTIADVASGSIGLGKIIEPLRQSAAHTIVIVDGCATEAVANRPSQARDAPESSATLFRASSNAEGEPANRGPEKLGVYVALSAQPGEVALDGDGDDSPFTTALLKELDTPGASIDDVMTRVRWDVFNATKGFQRTWSSSTLLGPGPLILNPGPISR